MERKKRVVYIDILRILACLMVIFNHSNERGFLRFVNDETGTLVFWIDLLCSMLCKSAVPIFFMITGAMLLCKEEDIWATFKRIPKILVDLILFSLLYFWTDSKLSGNLFSLQDTLKAIVGSNYWHMWYLYAYIALIITLPFFRKLIKGLDVESSFYMVFVAGAAMGIMPIIEYFWMGINGNLKPTWLTGYIFIYPAVGYVLDQVLQIEKVEAVHIGILWIVNVICITIGGVSEFFFLVREPGNSAETFLTNFCLINAAAVFVTVKYFFAKADFSGRLYKVVTETGKCTYGIYLLHIWFLWKIPFLSDIWAWGGAGIEWGIAVGKYIWVFISCILVFVITGVCTYILRRIPLICKLF